MSSAICWTNHSKAVHCQLSTTHSKLCSSQPSAFEEKFWNSEIWVTIFYRKRRDACIGWDLLQKRRRQTGDANVHKFAPQPNWARGPGALLMQFCTMRRVWSGRSGSGRCDIVKCQLFKIIQLRRLFWGAFWLLYISSLWSCAAVPYLRFS